LLDDAYLFEDKRWVRIAPSGGNETALLLARAAKPEQQGFVGHQTGGSFYF